VKTFPKSFIFLVIFIVLLFACVSFAAETNSCVMCHTSDSLMKSLHKPPPMPAGEGEG
jgi:hypothetical protein